MAGTNLYTILDAIATRLTSWTPTRATGLKFAHLTRIPNQIVNERSFYFDGKIETIPATTPSSDPFTSRITLVVNYPKRTERYSQLRDVTSDQEELFDRLSFWQGAEWSTSFVVQSIKGLGIEESESENLFTITIVLDAIYNRAT